MQTVAVTVQCSAEQRSAATFLAFGIPIDSPRDNDNDNLTRTRLP